MPQKRSVKLDLAAERSILRRLVYQRENFHSSPFDFLKLLLSSNCQLSFSRIFVFFRIFAFFWDTSRIGGLARSPFNEI